MILDTNALSAVGNQEPAILDFLLNSPAPVLCFIAVAEYRRGLLGSVRPQAGIELLAAFQATFPLLHSDDETISHYADIGHKLKTIGRPIPTNDVWIAALARQHALPVLSRDRHFDFIPGVERLAW